MTKHFLSVLAFVVVSFAVQGVSHFVINVEHFASIGFARPEPIIALGVLVMLIEGIILTLALQAYKPSATIKDGLMLSLAFGIFLASYIALVEPSKYAVPSIINWIKIEATASLVQFVAFGLILGYIHSKFQPNEA
ncbi:MAG: hypothetical protein COC24_009515 [Alphaproteobacteria bacterium]|nr:hypothetical protein [Alphaproteobacteria bacterium]